MTADDVAREITRRCWLFGVSVLIAPDESVNMDGRLVSGYFADEDRKLVVAGKFGDWIGTLLHEYCHLTQWAEDCDIWRRCKKAEATASIDEWLDGKPQRGIANLIDLTRELEADNERRTLRLIRELDAPVNVTEYARRANGYIHFHNVMRETRKWYRVDRRPYSTPEVNALCNDTIDSDFSRTPAALKAALLTCI